MGSCPTRRTLRCCRDLRSCRMPISQTVASYAGSVSVAELCRPACRCLRFRRYTPRTPPKPDPTPMPHNVPAPLNGKAVLSMAPTKRPQLRPIQD